jgi:uncharacterized protein YfiM (DUF2279 family)
MTAIARRAPRRHGRARRPALLAALFAAALLSPLPARAGRLFLPLDREGSWHASDKTLHFAASAALAASFRIEGAREETAFRATIGIGVAKELYDATLKPDPRRRGASRKDLVVDLLGSLAGLALLRALDR